MTVIAYQIAKPRPKFKVKSDKKELFISVFALFIHFTF